MQITLCTTVEGLFIFSSIYLMFGSCQRIYSLLMGILAFHQVDNKVGQSIDKTAIEDTWFIKSHLVRFIVVLFRQYSE